MDSPFNVHGGLTIVPMPGFEGMAEDIKTLIERRSGESDRKHTPVDIAMPVFKSHVNGEPDPRLDKSHIGDHDCVVLASGPGTYEMMGKLLFLLALLCGRRASRICVIFGYTPLSRSDKDETDQVLAWPQWFVQQMLSAAHGRLDRIITVDPHSDQIVMAGHPGLITPVTMMRRVFKQTLSASIELGRVNGGDVVVYFPDDGAAKRYEKPIDAVLDDMAVSVGKVYGTKRRSSSAESVPLNLSGDIKRLRDAIVICVDDEAATLGTQIHAAKRAKGQYDVAQFWAAVVHGVLCQDAVRKITDADSPIDRLIITDSIPQSAAVRGCPRVSVVSIAADLANMIYFHHWGEKVREQR